MHMTTYLDIDKRALRDVLGSFVTGVTVVTTVDSNGFMHGCTANSFTSVSLDPPLVLWSQALKARSYPAFRDADRFAINILSEDQESISQRFGSDKVEHKFEGIEWQAGLGGVPVLNGCAALIECRKVAAYPGGDHAIFLGQIENLRRIDRNPLVFGRGKYLRAYAPETGLKASESRLPSQLANAAQL